VNHVHLRLEAIGLHLVLDRLGHALTENDHRIRRLIDTVVQSFPNLDEKAVLSEVPEANCDLRVNVVHEAEVGLSAKPLENQPDEGKNWGGCNDQARASTFREHEVDERQCEK
jgi:hypothetical protein